MRGRATATADASARSMRRRRRWRRRTLRLLSALVATSAGGYVALLSLAPILLVTGNQADDPGAPADAIVVLGGHSVERAPVAAALYRAGRAPLVVASGDVDCGEVAEYLQAGGVPKGAIRAECNSGTTAENAAFSLDMLRPYEVERIIVVTSWAHTRRAGQCFRAAAGDGIAVDVVGSVAPPFGWRFDVDGDALHVVAEYVKIAWYGFGTRCARAAAEVGG